MTKVSSIVNGTFSSIAIELKIDGQRALQWRLNLRFHKVHLICTWGARHLVHLWCTPYVQGRYLIFWLHCMSVPSWLVNSSVSACRLIIIRYHANESKTGNWIASRQLNHNRNLSMQPAFKSATEAATGIWICNRQLNRRPASGNQVPTLHCNFEDTHTASIDANLKPE